MLKQEEIMKKIFVSCCMVALLMVPVFSPLSTAIARDEISQIETDNIDLDTVVLLKNQSTTVSAGLETPTSFQVIPVTLKGSSTFSASMSRNNTAGEIVYMFDWFPGVPATAFNIGVTPVTMRISSTIPNSDDGLVFGLVFTGILFSTVEPPFGYTVTCSY
jgi:hypothetical protein